MKFTVFGASGSTGLQLTRQALDAGHEVAAVTRRPDDFPITHRQLDVVGGDVYDQNSIIKAVDGADAVLSTLGVPFARQPITIYSTGIAAIAAAMKEGGVRRVVAVSSSATEPHHHAEGGFLLNRVLQPLVTATIGKTTYADMRAMEALLRASDLEWTVVRPSGLFDADAVSNFEVQEDQADGIFTSRADLAAFILAQATSDEWLRKTVAITTSAGAPTLFQMLRREAYGSH